MRVQKKAFAYRVPIGDYNYLQCSMQNLRKSFIIFCLNSKCLFGVFTFFQKTNKNKSKSSKVEFVFIRSLTL